MGEPALKDVRLDKEPAPARSRYEDDFYSWLLEQVDLLRSGRLDEIDLDHVAGELEGLSKSQFSKLQSCLRVLLMHMLKWDQQPEHRTATWIYAIREQRRRYVRIISESPGLKPRLQEARDAAYPDARDWASDGTHLEPEEFPEICPYTWDDIRERPFDLDSVKR